MPRKWILIVAATFLAASACAQDLDCNKRTVLTTEREDGTKMALVLNGAQLRASPKWQPGKGEPPLSVAGAVTIATSWAKDTYKRFDDMRVESISLSSTSCGRRMPDWYYVFHFTPVVDGDTLYGSMHIAAVLMDGTVVGPTKADGS